MSTVDAADANVIDTSLIAFGLPHFCPEQQYSTPIGGCGDGGDGENVLPVGSDSGDAAVFGGGAGAGSVVIRWWWWWRPRLLVPSTTVAAAESSSSTACGATRAGEPARAKGARIIWA